MPIVNVRNKYVPPIDVIPVSEVVGMLTEMFSNMRACDCCNNDEWLPFICEHRDNCLHQISNYEECWLQFLKHYHHRQRILNENAKA